MQNVPLRIRCTVASVNFSELLPDPFITTRPVIGKLWTAYHNFETGDDIYHGFGRECLHGFPDLIFLEISRTCTNNKLQVTCSGEISYERNLITHSNTQYICLRNLSYFCVHFFKRIFLHIYKNIYIYIYSHSTIYSFYKNLKSSYNLNFLQFLVVSHFKIDTFYRYNLKTLKNKKMFFFCIKKISCVFFTS